MRRLVPALAAIALHAAACAATPDAGRQPGAAQAETASAAEIEEARRRRAEEQKVRDALGVGGAILGAILSLVSVVVVVR